MRHRIVQVAGDDRLFRTYDYASRLQVLLNTVRAKITFLSGIVCGVDVQCIVRTSLHTRFATDALVGIKIDYAIFASPQRSNRTNANTRCIVAMIAAQHRKETSRVWESPFFDVLDPGSEFTQRNVVFGFTRDRASMTPNTPTLIYNETVAHLYLPGRARTFAYMAFIKSYLN